MNTSIARASSVKSLVSCFYGPFIFPYFANDSVGARDPLERSRMLIVSADVVLDCLDEVAHGMKGSATDAFACDLGKPAFDLVQPRGAGRSEVKVITRVCTEPPLHLRMLVGAVVVQNQMNIECSIGRTIELLQET